MGVWKEGGKGSRAAAWMLRNWGVLAGCSVPDPGIPLLTTGFPPPAFDFGLQLPRLPPWLTSQIPKATAGRANSNEAVKGSPSNQ